jgi:hypothetical protein
MGKTFMATPPADSTRHLLNQVSSSNSRLELWAEFIHGAQIHRMAEVGVYEGDFAAFMLERCESVIRYYLIDPWRHLDDWNKPMNQDDQIFERFFQAAKAKTDFAGTRRVFLRGKTTEVIDQIADGELDFAYIDGDHTLRGITVDLIRVYPKVRMGGFIGGDDFSRTMWQHKTNFEPTLVFPFAVYFAEAVGATIYALPYMQFCLQKTSETQFSFVDLTGQYDELGLRYQLAPENLLKISLGERFPGLMRIARKTKGLAKK